MQMINVDFSTLPCLFDSLFPVSLSSIRKKNKVLAEICPPRIKIPSCSSVCLRGHRAELYQIKKNMQEKNKDLVFFTHSVPTDLFFSQL